MATIGIYGVWMFKLFNKFQLLKQGFERTIFYFNNKIDDLHEMHFQISNMVKQTENMKWKHVKYISGNFFWIFRNRQKYRISDNGGKKILFMPVKKTQ